jgi:carboxymethylenebutenolidase
MDQRIIDLFDHYTHGAMPRREFLERLTSLAGTAAAAAALLPLLQNNYAHAEIIAENDSRIVTETLDFPGGSGYFAKPAEGDKFPGVLVIHENRGLNPHIKDVTRRFAVDGFAALAPDYLAAKGGTPTNEDKARDMIGEISPEEALATSKAALAALKSHPSVSGKAGAVGFCWGGGAVNALAVAESGLAAGVAYYGRQPDPASVPSITAPLLLHYAGLDERINAGIAAFEEALKGAGKTYEIYMYEGANHAFNNDTNAARYNKESADLAWGRTIAFLKKHIG